MEPPLEPPRADTALDPATTAWSTGRPLFRVHGASAANAFNPGYGRGRFHPLWNRRGESIPTLYAADEIDGALSETVFRGVAGGREQPRQQEPAAVAGDDDAGGFRGRIHRDDLESLRLSRLVLEGDLRLVDMTGLALRRLGLKRGQLLEAPERLWQVTARWAEALHEAASSAHGLLWISRQCDTAKVVVLFGDRVDASWLRPDGPAEALHDGRGFQRVCEAAERANIAVIR